MCPGDQGMRYLIVNPNKVLYRTIQDSSRQYCLPLGVPWRHAGIAVRDCCLARSLAL